MWHSETELPQVLFHLVLQGEYGKTSTELELLPHDKPFQDHIWLMRHFDFTTIKGEKR